MRLTLVAKKFLKTRNRKGINNMIQTKLNGNLEANKVYLIKIYEVVENNEE